MDIKGFKSKDGTVYKYDYDALVNKPDSSQNDYQLPVATAETLGGVMPVAKTDDMTQPVGVDENGQLYTAPGSAESGGLNVAGTPKSGYFVGLTDDLTPTWMTKEGEVYFEVGANLATTENTSLAGYRVKNPSSLGGEDIFLEADVDSAYAKIEIPEGADVIALRWKVMGWQANYTGNIVFADENGTALWCRCPVRGNTETADGWCIPDAVFSGVGDSVTVTIAETGALFDISALSGAKYLYFTTIRYDGLAATDIGVYIGSFPDSVKYDSWFVLGDSLSAGNRSHADSFYYEFVQNHLGKTITLNKLAEGSKNSVSVVSEQIPQIVEVEGKRNLITCMIGTNDTFETEDAFKTNIESIISTVQTNCPNSTLVMITNPPRFDSEDYAAKMLTNANTIKEVCAEKNVKCIDFYHECGFAEANLAYFFCSDNLHLTTEGQRILATLLEPFVHSFFTI